MSFFLFRVWAISVVTSCFVHLQERDESMHSGSEYDPVRYEQDIYSEYGASVYDDTDYFDGTTVYSGTTTPRAGVYSVHSGVGQMGSQKRRNDIARSHFGLGDPPSKPNDEVGEPLPVTLQRRMVEQDGDAGDVPTAHRAATMGPVRGGRGPENRRVRRGGAPAPRRAQPRDATDIQAQVRPMG